MRQAKYSYHKKRWKVSVNKTFSCKNTTDKSENTISSCKYDYDAKQVEYLEWLVKLVEGVWLYGCGVHAGGCLEGEVAGHDKLPLSILIELLQVWCTRYAPLNYLNLR